MRCGGTGIIHSFQGMAGTILVHRRCSGCEECKGSGELPVDMTAIGLPEYSDHEGSAICSTCDGSGVKP